MSDEVHSLTAENLLASLPEVLQNDENMMALASAIADLLTLRKEEIGGLSIYPQLESLPEDLLDILAYDFKVDWYDYDYSEEEKRKTLADSFSVHRRLGTPYAVLAAISAIYPGTTLQEWFEYGGDPYHFKLLIDATNDEITSAKHQRVLERIRIYKNARSVLDDVNYSVERELTNRLYFGVAFGVTKSIEATCETPVLVEFFYLVDEAEDLLTDENGNTLIE